MPAVGMERRFLVHFALGGVVNAERLRESVPGILDILKSISRDDMVQAYRSAGGETFGYFVKSKLAAVQIRAALEAPKGALASPLRNGDAYMVVELGEEFATTGAGRAGTWLQHR